jgi:hypothetical protein
LRNYIAEPCARADRPENLEVATEEEVVKDEKGLYVLYSEVQEDMKEMKNKKATRDDYVLKMYSNFRAKME